MKMFGKYREISLINCKCSKWDLETSLFINHIEDKSISKWIKWSKTIDPRGFWYNSAYTNPDKPEETYKLKLRYTATDGIELEASVKLNGVKIVKIFTEWDYPTELQDLMTAVNGELPHDGVYDYCGITKYPYYSKELKEIGSATKVLTARGKKNEKILKDLKWDYNCQVLGE